MDMTFYIYGKKNGFAQEYKATAPITELWSKYPESRQRIIEKLKEQSPFEKPLIFSSKQDGNIEWIINNIESEF